MPDKSRLYAHDLQSMTLKEVQPRIAENMESILEEINAHDDIQIHCARSRYPNRRYQTMKYKKSKSSPMPKKSCILCKAGGRHYLGHDAGTCWFTSKFEKQEIAKALLVEMDDDQVPDEGIHNDTISYVDDDYTYRKDIENTSDLAMKQKQDVHFPKQDKIIYKVQSDSSP